MRKAEEALAKGDMAEYHSRLTKATLMQAEQRIMSRLPPPQPQYQPPPQFQKPIWATAVEAKFPDVILHPSGLNTVATFAQLDPQQIGPEKLERAFNQRRGAPACGLNATRTNAQQQPPGCSPGGSTQEQRRKRRGREGQRPDRHPQGRGGEELQGDRQARRHERGRLHPGLRPDEQRCHSKRVANAQRASGRGESPGVRPLHRPMPSLQGEWVQASPPVLEVLWLGIHGRLLPHLHGVWHRRNYLTSVQQ